MKWVFVIFGSALFGLAAIAIVLIYAASEIDKVPEIASKVGPPDEQLREFSDPELIRSVFTGDPDGRFCHINHSPCDQHPIPQINYPTTPVPKQNFEADCVVEYIIGEDGKPFDIEATCSNPAFVRSAERGIAKMQYATEDKCGPCERNGERVSFPIEYRLTD